MKLKSIVTSALTLTLALCGSAYASSFDYFPPERINCKLNELAKLACDGFDRSFLSEDTYTVDFPPAKEIILHFVTAVAYWDLRKNESSIFFTYNNSDHKMVKLKTVSTRMYPDLSYQTWVKLKDDVYQCRAGYMQCPITNMMASNNNR